MLHNLDHNVSLVDLGQPHDDGRFARLPGAGPPPGNQPRRDRIDPGGVARNQGPGEEKEGESGSPTTAKPAQTTAGMIADPNSKHTQKVHFSHM